MLKKALLALILALQFAAVANVVTASAPWPSCFPCDEAR
jgi:hypothetical protein